MPSRPNDIGAETVHMRRFRALFGRWSTRDAAGSPLQMAREPVTGQMGYDIERSRFLKQM